MRLERSWLCFALFSLLVALGLDVLVVLLLLRRVHLLQLLHLRLGDLFAGSVVGRDALCEKMECMRQTRGVVIPNFSDPELESDLLVESTPNGSILAGICHLLSLFVMKMVN